MKLKTVSYSDRLDTLGKSIVKAWQDRSEHDQSDYGYVGSAGDELGDVLEDVAGEDACLVAEWLRYIANRITQGS